MSHIEHYTKGSINNLMKEHERLCQAYKNKVDLSRSNRNLVYGCSGLTPAEISKKFRDRTKEITGRNKIKDTTHICCEWVIQLPERYCKRVINDKFKDKKGEPIPYNVPLDKEQSKRFFDTVYDFIGKRYGKDNVIGAWVHYDETTPHIHVAFVPEAISRKDKDHRKITVSSASCITRDELRAFHPELERYCNERGFEGVYKDSITSEPIYKKEKRLEKKEKDLTKREKALNKREAEISKKDAELTVKETQTRETINQLLEQISVLKSKIKALDEELSNKERRNDELTIELNRKERQNKEFVGSIDQREIVPTNSRVNSLMIDDSDLY